MRKLISAGLFLASALFASSVHAASHPLAKVTYDATTGTAYIDQVVAIDWDINNPPSLTIDGVSTPLDKAYLLGVLNVASDTLYTMSEGKLRLGKMSVYSNQYLDNADMTILNKDGRANAHLSGLNVRGARNQVFTISGSPETLNALGRTIGHEFGHYILGVYDEYREAGNMDTSNPGSPQDGDTPRNTIMQNHLEFNSLSTPADYADPLQRQTAHYRVFGQSAWETLIADPKNDAGGSQRMWFDVFKNMSLPATLTMPVNTEASRASIQMTYMNGSRTVIVIDLGVTQTELAGFIRAAEAIVDAVDSGSQVAILTVSGIQFNTPVELTTLGAGDADPARVAVKAALAALVPGASVAGGLDGALLQASIIASPLAAAQDAAAKSGLAAPLSNTIEISQTPIITLLTTLSATVTSATIQALAQGGAMLNPMLLNNSPAEANKMGMSTERALFSARMRALSSNAMAGNMDALAKATNGRMVETRSASDLAQKSTQVMNETEGDMLQTITADTADSLAAGAALTMTTPIASSAIDGEVTISAYLGGNTGMNLTLTSPAGTVINSKNAAALGVIFENNAEEGIQSYVIPTSFTGRAGNWIATVTALTASTEPVDMEATVASQLTVKSFIYGGTLADTRPPVLSATLSQPLGVKNATLTASVYDINQVLVKDGIVLKDDGVSPDVKSGDGIYTASLAGIITAIGEYGVDIHISNEGLKAVYGTTGSRVAGANLPDVPITQNFMRDDSITYNVQVAGIDTVTSPLTGLWWNQNESGWGMSLTQHGAMIFAAWYTYDATAQPVWYVMSACAVSGSSCTGDIYSVSGGTQPGVTWNGNGKVVTKVGSGTITFTDNNTGSFNFTLNGVTGSKNITRQVFATGSTAPAINYSSLWWNANESGWGVALTHQYGVIFATMYTYDASGKPVWYVASNCAVVSNGCSGDLYKVTNGSIPTVTWNGGSLAVTKAGTVNFLFTDSSTGTMNYTINGVSGSKAIAVQPF